MTLRTSIVIPAYNEAQRLPATLGTLLDYAAKHKGEIEEILVVDDGSTDQTPMVVRQLEKTSPLIRLIRYSRNGGKGYAIRRGVVEARGDLVLLSDADLSTPITELDRLRSHIDAVPIVIGSRAVDTSTVRVSQRWYRQQMGIIFNRIMRALTGLSYGDTQCGFKLLRRDVAREIFREATVDRFAYDVEMLMIAEIHGYSVIEVSVLWFNSPDSRVHVLRDSARMLVDVIGIRARLGRRKMPETDQGHHSG